MSVEKELIVAPPQETALAVYSAEKGLEPWMEKIRAKIDEFLAVVPDLKTAKGRKEIASMAYEVARTKTAIENKGKELSAEQKKVPGRIDAERKRVWDILETWQKEVRKPLDDWQAAEDKRVDAHNEKLEWLRGLPLNLTDETSAHVQGLIDQAEAVSIDDKWEEFKAEAAGAKDLAIKSLRAVHAELQRYEADQAELARLRAEAEAQAQRDRDAEIARVAAEKARIEAEQRAQAERNAAARREQELLDQAAATQRAAAQAALDAEAAAERQRLQLELQAEQSRAAAAQAEASRLAAVQRAEQERIDSERRQAEAAENARLAEIARANAAADEINRQAAAREADKAHKARINRAALDAFVAGGMTEECAKQAITLIAKRQIPAIAITY
ncbi:hypothetical protein ACOI7N_13755 [Pseudomonas sp. P2758]|uniref:hypothetical protein n=1 Tax=Pseudomonas sp. P2758 TaxID=3409916 RepID=UPI003B5996D4